jgi:ppGpp synthetase/RelA/SpoT-type nucleotidyltranferase
MRACERRWSLNTGLAAQPMDEDDTWAMTTHWASPQYTIEEVNAAGRQLLVGPTGIEYLDALDTISNWRSSHNFPLNTFQTTLRRKVPSGRIVAQRIKRLVSIEKKLRRFSWLNLSEMQDIGGCRAVMASVKEVQNLVSEYRKSDLRHVLDDSDDYINNPKPSGYRGFHLVYCYQSDKKQTYNNLKIEMQIRSPLQHQWATAVETVDAFTGQALKSSSGDKEWRRFFKLIGTVIAQTEKTSPVPNTPTTKGELLDELRDLTTRLDVATRLGAYQTTLQTTQDPNTKDSHSFLLQLDTQSKNLLITGFQIGQSKEAEQRYLDAEKDLVNTPGADAVLVSVNEIKYLQRAYPNYFADTTEFIKTVQAAIAPAKKHR